MGRLNKTEQFAIKGMVAEGLSTSEIAEALGRTEKCIENYISKNLVMPVVGDEELKIVTDSVLNDYFDAVVKTLMRKGMTENDAERVCNAAIRANKAAGVEIRDEQHLYTECIKRLNAGTFMVKKTQGGKEGVAIMTAAASQHSDEFKKKKKSPCRKARKNVWNPKTGQYM